MKETLFSISAGFRQAQPAEYFQFLQGFRQAQPAEYFQFLQQVSTSSTGEE